jgi:photosystem II stability/assembly factor-like uncharacterized protein
MNLYFKIILVLFVSCLLQADNNSEVQFYLQPSELSVFSEGSVKNEKRDEWIQQMHKSAPEHSWRKIEQENQIYRISKKSDNHPVDTSLHFLNGSWREIGSKNLAGRVLITEYDAESNQIICASDGGNIWISDYDDISWEVINDDYRIQEVCFLKKNNDRILVASSTWGIQGFFYSDDMGENWKVAEGLDNVSDWGKIVSCYRKYNGEIYLSAVEWDNTSTQKIVSIYKSADNGESFSRLTYFSESEVENENKLCIWTSDLRDVPVYVLKNGTFNRLNGNALVEISTIPETAGNFLLQAYVSDMDTAFYIANYSNNYTTFYASLNGGKNWAILSSVNENPFRRNSFAVSPTDKNTMFFGGVHCYKTYNLGASWDMNNNWDEYYAEIETKLHADIPSIDIFEINNQEVVFVSTDGGLYISEDNLNTVQNISLENHNISQYYSVYTSRINPTHIHAGSQDQGFQNTNSTISTDPINFRQVISGDYGHIVSSDYGASIWMVYPGFVMYYSDIINSEKSYMQDFDFSGNLWMPPLMDDPENPTSCYLGGGSYSSGAKLIHVSKIGERLSFEELDYGFTNSGNSAISALAHSKINTDYWYVLNSDGEFYYSTDAGENWDKTTDFTAPEHQYFYGATILPSKTTLGKVYVGGSGYSNSPVFVTEDNGVTFSAMSNGLPSTLVYKLDSDEEDNFVFAATESGPYIYDNEQEQWFDIAFNDAPDQTYWDVDYVENLQIARFATYGRGIWDYIVNSENSIEQLISDKNKAVSYPNPSNGDFWVKFSKNTTWPKTVDIYNIAGQLMHSEELVYMYPNEYKVSTTLQSGNYFVRISQPEGADVIKILIQ